jgi:hypothetical protein
MSERPAAHPPPGAHPCKGGAMPMRYEVLDAKWDDFTHFWVLRVKGTRVWTVIFHACRGFQDVVWRVQTRDENGLWRFHARGFIPMPHRQMLRRFPATNEAAVRFFYQTLLPDILTRFPEF